MSNQSIIEELKRYEPVSMSEQLPVVWDHCEGDCIIDSDNNKYIDFTSGIFVANSGHSNRYVRNALIRFTRLYSVNEEREQTLPIHTYTFPNIHRLILLKTLIGLAPSFCEKVYLASTGTEAVEAAIRIMRMHFYNRKPDFFRSPPAKPVPILALQGSMHGRSQATRALSEYDHLLTDDYGPVPGIITLDDIDAMLKWPWWHKTAGVILEPYFGWSAKFHDIDKIKKLRQILTECGAILCFDEVQGGFARTGKMFAYEHYGIEPDLICVGKGLGGGLPMSAVLGRAADLDRVHLSSTHSGNVLCCAAATANLNFIRSGELVYKAKLIGDHFELGLGPLLFDQHVVEINIKGAIAGIVVDNEQTATAVCHAAMKKGLLLVLTGRNSVKIGPPLTIEHDQLAFGIKTIIECFEELK